MDAVPKYTHTQLQRERVCNPPLPRVPILWVRCALSAMCRLKKTHPPPCLAILIYSAAPDGPSGAAE